MQQNDATKEKCNTLWQAPAQGGGRKYKRGPVKQAQDLAIKAMLLQGTPQRKIAAALGINASAVQRVRDEMKARAPDAGDLKSSLMSPHLGEMSVAVVEHFLKKGATLRTVKGSDAMAAVKAVQDRQCPVPGDAPAPSRTFIRMDLSIFLPGLAPAPQDAPVDTTCSVLEDGKETREKNLNQFSTCSVP